MTHPGHAPDPTLASQDSGLIEHNALVGCKYFGDNARRLRMELRIPQKQLARKVGVSPTTITRMELHGKPIMLTTAIAIADALGTRVGALLDE